MKANRPLIFSDMLHSSWPTCLTTFPVAHTPPEHQRSTSMLHRRHGVLLDTTLSYRFEWLWQKTWGNGCWLVLWRRNGFFFWQPDHTARVGVSSPYCAYWNNPQVVSWKILLAVDKTEPLIRYQILNTRAISKSLHIFLRIYPFSWLIKCIYIRWQLLCPPHGSVFSPPHEMCMRFSKAQKLTGYLYTDINDTQTSHNLEPSS